MGMESSKMPPYGVVILLGPNFRKGFFNGPKDANLGNRKDGNLRT